MSVELIQGKDPADLASKVDRASIMLVEILGAAEFCSKAKPNDVIHFFNNVESVYDHLIRRNRCFRIDAKFENLISSGAAEKVARKSFVCKIIMLLLG